MLKIIAVDDEFQILNLLPKIIDWELFGFELTETFSKAEEALKYIKNNHVDVIFSDICMPGMDGFDFVKEVSEGYRNISVVILTAHQKFEYAQRLIQFGIFDYLTKPIDYDSLTNLLERLKAHHLQMADIVSNDDSFAVWSLQQAVFDFSSDSINMSQLCDIFKTQDIDLKLQECVSAIVCVKIFDLLNVLSNSWYYGLDRLYVRIMQLMQNQNFHAVLISSSFDQLRILVIGRDGYEEVDFRERIEIYLDEVGGFLKDCLMLDTSIEVKQIIADFGEIKKYIHLNYSTTLQGQSFKLTNKEIVLRAQKYIEENFSENPSLPEISERLYISPYHLSRIFKKEHGVNISEYILNQKLECAKNLLLKGSYTVAQVAKMAGFGNRNYFHRIFKNNVGITPSEYTWMHNELNSEDKLPMGEKNE